jgi:SRSO17 transposase
MSQSQVQSDKKNFAFFGDNRQILSDLWDYTNCYSHYFQAWRYNNTQTAFQYLEGLIACERGKANMERMEEEIDDSDYRAYQHFITNSTWDDAGLLQQVSLDASEVLQREKCQNGHPVGVLIDESAHLKKGDMSVGVSRQYAGVVGKVDNCQVGVYSSLVNGESATLVHQRLFLPESWTSSPSRCEAAGIPESHRSFQTKLALALAMIDDLLLWGVLFDWVVGDGLYGHGTAFCRALHQRGLFYVPDVHKDMLVYLGEPHFSLPEKKSNRGRPPTVLKSDCPRIRLDDYMETLEESAWVEEKIRKTAKGWLVLKIHKTNVWLKDTKTGEIFRQTLIITRTTDGKNEIKYSLSNGELDAYTHKEYAYFQAQRYWVERTFQNAKSELGLSDYQVRKWRSWQHHHVLVMMACLYMMKTRIENHQTYPLLSVSDTRILIIAALFGTEDDLQKRMQQMEIRHKKRQADIDRRYKINPCQVE